MADQIVTVSKKSLQQRVGRLSASDMTAVERAIRVQLGM
jgi:mRNA-degrading endonuclease toxin of MazEF toxin-antitoxin module